MVITSEHAAEFRGLFFGEGHLDLIRSGRTDTLVPRMRVAMRDDDLAVLHWCLGLFGGNLARRIETRSTTWQLTGVVRLTPAVMALEGGSIPSKKRAEVTLFREALGLVSTRGRHQTVEARDRLHQIRDEMKAVRRFAEVA